MSLGIHTKGCDFLRIDNRGWSRYTVGMCQPKTPALCRQLALLRITAGDSHLCHATSQAL